jgi:Glycoside hydrolase 123, catalytic domain/Glycoside hydrolase 123 N-terminal domain
MGRGSKMSRWRMGFLALLVMSLFVTSCGPGTGSHGLRAWYVDSLIKVFPADAVGTSHLASAEFIAARNQHLNIQIALRSTRPFSAVSVRLEPPKDDQGHMIVTSDASIRQVGYVVVGSHTPKSPPDELVGTAPGWYPDALLPLPLDLEANRTHSIWVEIHVPSDTPPGVYRGAIDIDANQQALASLPFRLTVDAATVPKKRSLEVTNWFSLGDQKSQQFYGGSAFSEGWWKLVANVAQVFADHRQNVVFTPLMELIQPKVTRGRLQYDFSNFDRWVETFQAAGAIGYIEGSHLLTRPYYSAPLDVPVLEREGNKVVTKTLPPDSPEVSRFLAGFLSALNKHLETKGWKSIYFQHVLDEAHGNEIPYYGRIAAQVRRYMPGVQTIDAIDAKHIPEIIRRDCDIWVPVLGSFDNAVEPLEQRIASGHPVWYYTCLYPRGKYINRLMDFPLIKTRLLPWLDFRYNFTGFLHWGANSWTPKPMLDTQPVINNNRQLLPSGDAFIYYPDRQHMTFASSIRMETFLAGIEDYELLHQLETDRPAEARVLANRAISSFTDYVRDAAAFRKIENDLLSAASKR